MIDHELELLKLQHETELRMVKQLLQRTMTKLDLLREYASTPLDGPSDYADGVNREREFIRTFLTT